jgi:hypothetical protein
LEEAFVVTYVGPHPTLGRTVCVRATPGSSRYAAGTRWGLRPALARTRGIVAATLIVVLAAATAAFRHVTR